MIRRLAAWAIGITAVAIPAALYPHPHTADEWASYVAVVFFSAIPCACFLGAVVWVPCLRLTRHRGPSPAARPPSALPASLADHMRGAIPRDGKPLTRPERAALRVIEASFARTIPTKTDGDSR